MKGKGAGAFDILDPAASGLFADGDIRAAAILKDANNARKLIIVKNNDAAQTFTIQQP